jgi:hypothetical protein
MNEDAKNRRFSHSMVISWICKDLDSISNSSKEDRLVISGLTSKTPKPAGVKELPYLIELDLLSHCFCKPRKQQTKI